MPPLFALSALFSLFASVIPGTLPSAVNHDQAQLITWGVAGVILVIAMQALSLVFTGVRAMRRTPPLHETFATKAEAAALSDRIAKSEARSDASLKEIFDELRTIHRSLGRVEALEGSVKSMHQDTNERLGELNARLKP